MNEKGSLVKYKLGSGFEMKKSFFEISSLKVEGSFKSTSFFLTPSIIFKTNSLFSLMENKYSFNNLFSFST